MQDPKELTPSPNSLHKRLAAVLLAATAGMVALHYVHLAADFPHDAPWKDPARATDEGWYAGAALRALLSGHWRLDGDFNPAVTLPVFPTLVYLLFRVTGVSVIALRALNVTCMTGSVALVWKLSRRYTSATAAGLAALLFATSPLYFVYSRLGILEPLLVLEMLLTLLLADRWPEDATQSEIGPGTSTLRTIVIGVLMAMMLLTKTTGICCFPAVLYLVWIRASETKRALRDVALAIACCATVMSGYIAEVCHAGLMVDFVDLFAVNNDRVNKRTLLITLFHAVRDSRMVGSSLLVAFALVLASLLFLKEKRRLRRPMLVALLLAIGGFGAFITYHGWLMPRYYLPLVPLLILSCVLAVHEVLTAERREMRAVGMCIAGALLLSAAFQAGRVVRWALRPSYSFLEAARTVRAGIDADGDRNPVILSSYGEELGLLNQEHGEFINVQYGTQPLRQRILALNPGWMVTFDRPEPAAADAVLGVDEKELVLTEPAFGDDATHNRLLLYRLKPIR